LSRSPLRERSLAVVAPVVAAQLHPTRNGPTTAETVSAGSRIRLWWQCPAGHDWQATVTDRTSGTGCPYCAGRLPTPDTCLATRNPALAAQWHLTRNGALTPADVLPSSNRRVWWQCSWGHAWPARVSSRSAGSGCPDCPRPPKAPTLLGGHPDLAAQWDSTANGALTDAVTSGSRRQVGWRCQYGHTWVARVQARTVGQGCPYCAGRRATPETSVAAVHPQLMAEWAADLNSGLDPATVLPGSMQRVWWRCTTDPDHVWQVRVGDRTSRGTGCPFCVGTRVTPQASLAAAYPEVAAEWDPDRNGTLTAAGVRPSSNKHAWWRCPAGHCWEAQIASRTTGGCGCPYCAGRRATPATSLAAADPDLAAQWDPDRNGTLTPAAVRPGSSRYVWWRCPAGHRWRAQIQQRTRQHTGCPVCASPANHGRQLANTFPDLAAQWADALNGGGPGTITTGSHVKAWWRCPADPTHLWRAGIIDRTRGRTGCPYCAHTRPTPTTCLAAVAPQLIPEWHPTRNKDLSPTDVLPYSATAVWWRCPDHHEWATTPAARLAGGTSCPDCAARNRPVHHQPARPAPKETSTPGQAPEQPVSACPADSCLTELGSDSIDGLATPR